MAPNNNLSPGTGLLSSRDMFFTTRIRDTGTALEFPIQLANDDQKILEGFGVNQSRLWIIDLDSAEDMLGVIPNVIEAAPQLRIIAFGSHVEVERLKKARAAGCHLVVPRSQFTQKLAEYLQEAKEGKA